ncbi:hypothetical protein [Acidocella sp.]|uniref:hypothetical protein n=1 Tax=Acidocella sp. TaxID=50710 RepID=UPI002623B661|nr:hypothetical protein [Acidocella sp.]
MKKILPLLMLLSVAGCARGPGYRAQMTAFVGAPETRLVQDLGVPDKQISLNGYEYLAYVRARGQLVPGGGMAFYQPWGGPYWGGYGGPVLVEPMPQDMMVWRCEATFAVQNGKVLGVTFRGDDCQ